jgi:hypothetical protein
VKNLHVGGAHAFQIEESFDVAMQLLNWAA